MKSPFVAAVGVENRGQYAEIAHADIDRRLGEIAVGVLMSEKTGLENIPNRHGVVYPLFDTALEITTASEAYGIPHIPVIIHYNTDRPEVAGDQLVEALDKHQKVDAVQINGLRPEHWANLVNLSYARPEIDIVVQIDAEMLDRYRNRPDELANELAVHRGVVDYAWLDGSGGYGKALDIRGLSPFIEALDQKGIGVGVAGGLNAENVENLLNELLEQYSGKDSEHPIPISWDAQSGVMDEVGGGRRFNTKKAADFLRASLNLRHRNDSV